MELVARHLWVVSLVVIVVGTVEIERTGAAVVRSALEPLPEGLPGVPPAPARRPGRTLELGPLARVMGLAVRERAAGETLAGGSSGEPVRSPLPFRLLGTLVSPGAPRWSAASIHDPLTSRTGTFMERDLLGDARILAIERQRVIILNGERREFIDAAGSPAVPGAVPAPGPGSIRQVSENHVELSRAELLRVMSSPSPAAWGLEGHIVPAFHNGQVRGFRVLPIRPGSLYERLGLRNGDIVTRVNGVELTSPKRALELLSLLRDTSRIEVEVDRGGTLVTKTYSLL